MTVTDAMIPDLSGKVALVTGVGRAGQIGNAICLALGRAGACIVASDRNAVAVAQRVREFVDLGIDARPVAGDLTSADAASLAVEMARRHYGRLDIVVNVAGGLTTFGPIANVRPADVDRELSINVKTAFLVSQAAINELAEARGVIINFSSIAVLEPAADIAIYTAAKSAVAGLTRAMAVELASLGIRVNAIASGMVRTAENVESAGDSAQYVELEAVTRGVLDLAAGLMTGEIRAIRPGSK